jgi:hypothetical protein
MAKKAKENLQKESLLDPIAEFGVETAVDTVYDDLPPKAKKAASYLNPEKVVAAVPPVLDPVRAIKQVPHVDGRTGLVKGAARLTARELDHFIDWMHRVNKEGPFKGKFDKEIEKHRNSRMSHMMHRNEEKTEINELSDKLLIRYLGAANRDIKNRRLRFGSVSRMLRGDDLANYSANSVQKSLKRVEGMSKAAAQLQWRQIQKGLGPMEEGKEFLDELSKKTLWMYIKKAIASDAHNTNLGGSFAVLGNKRDFGVKRAMKKFLKTKPPINEISTKLLQKYISKAGPDWMIRSIGVAGAIRDAAKVGKFHVPEKLRLQANKRLTGLDRAGRILQKRGIEELSIPTLARYLKKATPHMEKMIGDLNRSEVNNSPDNFRLFNRAVKRTVGVETAIRKIKGFRLGASQMKLSDRTRKVYKEDASEFLNEISTKLALRYLVRRGAIFVDARKKQITFPSQQFSHLEKSAEEARFRASVRGHATRAERDTIRVHNNTAKATNYAMNKVVAKHAKQAETAAQGMVGVRDALLRAEKERLDHALLVGKSPTIRMQIKKFAHHPTEAPKIPEQPGRVQSRYASKLARPKYLPPAKPRNAKKTNESTKTENLDEISKLAMLSYLIKAPRSLKKLADKSEKYIERHSNGHWVDEKEGHAVFNRMANRSIGMKMANARLRGMKLGDLTNKVMTRKPRTSLPKLMNKALDTGQSLDDVIRAEYSKEETEHLGELSNGVLGKYINKAIPDLRHLNRKLGGLIASGRRGGPFVTHKVRDAERKASVRAKGISTAYIKMRGAAPGQATAKLKNRGYKTNNEETLNELSPQTLFRYVVKASRNFKTTGLKQRAVGIKRAIVRGVKKPVSPVQEGAVIMNELGNGILGRYMNKASKEWFSAAKAQRAITLTGSKGTFSPKTKYLDQIMDKRNNGMRSAEKKLTYRYKAARELDRNEDSKYIDNGGEFLAELSKTTLASYLVKRVGYPNYVAGAKLAVKGLIGKVTGNHKAWTRYKGMLKGRYRASQRLMGLPPKRGGHSISDVIRHAAKSDEPPLQKVDDAVARLHNLPKHIKDKALPK